MSNQEEVWQLVDDKKLNKLWRKRQRSYENERNKKYKTLSNTISPIGGVGGTTKSIKCLHSHLADELVSGENVIGKVVLESVGGCNCNEPCIIDGFRNDKWRIEW